ncbi:MAG: hypothetical protein AAGF67_08270 [Verrucomicrobiota bacterium]
MKKLIYLALPLLALFLVPDTADAGYGYGGYRSFGGYYGHGYRSYGYGLSSRYRSPAFHYYNGGRGHFRDSGHSNLRTYRVYRNQALQSKKATSAKSFSSKFSSNRNSIFKRKLFR